ncbi:plasmid mobilization protein [Hespellia stercorisuis]|uniref:Mobilisation protein (MobC) n=1 Tax=Hespellia stercorisuis DSM 15480 TaxID=1121950 RepID=A0A1M6KUC2_9FIRM|nr:plasmid mobilization relaxosome protein MobC [Hespellia stercorisuis]SHJ62509.1 mobilisation protein (MobC) [Hespellia stercorisuis DSM 15480]
MLDKKVKRKRNKAVTIRMSDIEYESLQDKVDESGLSQQAYIISSIQGSTITSSDEIAVQKDISKTFADLVKQLRGLATNVNQMAHVANGQGILPTTTELIKASDEISHYRKECEELWLLIRSSINQQNRTER